VVGYGVGSTPAITQIILFFSRLTIFSSFLFFPDHFKVIKSFYFFTRSGTVGQGSKYQNINTDTRKNAKILKSHKLTFKKN
jgi:hypothetical protein